MSALFIPLFLFLAIALIGLVLLQEGKGGGLTGNAAGMDSVMGARNPLRRWTAYFFIAFVVLVIGINKWYANRSHTSLIGIEPPAVETGMGSIPAPGDGESVPATPPAGSVGDVPAPLPAPETPADGAATPETPVEAPALPTPPAAPEAPAPAPGAEETPAPAETETPAP